MRAPRSSRSHIRDSAPAQNALLPERLQRGGGTRRGPATARRTQGPIPAEGAVAAQGGPAPGTSCSLGTALGPAARPLRKEQALRGGRSSPGGAPSAARAGFSAPWCSGHRAFCHMSRTTYSVRRSLLGPSRAANVGGQRGRSFLPPPSPAGHAPACGGGKSSDQLAILTRRTPHLSRAWALKPLADTCPTLPLRVQYEIESEHEEQRMPSS